MSQWLRKSWGARTAVLSQPWRGYTEPIKCEGTGEKLRLITLHVERGVTSAYACVKGKTAKKCSERCK